jgi:cell division protease FtsH
MTTGAGNDIERVSDIARRMVCEWGMSDAVGPLTFRAANPLSNQPGQIISEQTAVLIDGEVKKIVQSSYDTARSLLEKHRLLLDAITNALLERETISRADIQAIIEKTEKN